ncbi:uncharacterized protein MONBRDRAFT_27869 [Monosiga brevicollis MX1]|uniref:Metallo-beta-lactamase domain-containing protein n=1 Tax=Monosiga brevicollis TaxID=81824 RepID=A9V6Q2_MONBE|nr:uncharacterized protein MONBRDRAFT_27869 [Monosiga brevicollis MX1]EDQ86845.1 predicted protein [Monosiga brevicollis MX1]|eukprot:XP_001748390.1 hypothetical protein [Monosiga brevicollis MX1]
MLEWHHNLILFDVILPPEHHLPDQPLYQPIRPLNEQGIQALPKKSRSSPRSGAGVNLLDDVFSVVPPDAIDAVFVSSEEGLWGLPYLTERLGYCGDIYATDPVKQLGLLLLQGKAEREARRKTRNDFAYTPTEVQNCFDRITSVSYREHVKLHEGVQAWAVSAGYALGSAVWILSDGVEQVGLLRHIAPNDRRHPKPFAQQALASCGTLVCSHLKMADHDPNQAVQRLAMTVGEAVSQGGHVVIPVDLNGVFLDLMELLMTHLQNCGVVANMVVVGRYAKAVLAYADIYSAWLAKSKRSRVYEPKPPFPYNEFIQSGHIKLFSSVLDPEFSRLPTGPAVFFVEDPSLRYGDGLAAVEMIMGNPHSAIIGISPTVDIVERVGVFSNVRARVIQLPIDAGLHPKDLNNLLRHMQARKVILGHRQVAAVPNPDSRLQALEAASTVEVTKAEPVNLALLDPRLVAPNLRLGRSEYQQLGAQLQQTRRGLEVAPQADGGFETRDVMGRPSVQAYLVALSLHNIFDAEVERIGIKDYAVVAQGVRVEFFEHETLIVEAPQATPGLVELCEACLQLAPQLVATS